MNKYIQEFLKQQEEREKKSLMSEVNKVIQKIEIGEKVYNEHSKSINYEYPKFDAAKKMPYKYDIGDATVEELRLVLQVTTPKKESVKPLTWAKRSSWDTFATIMIIISSIGLFLLGIISISEDDMLYFSIGLGEFIIVLFFCAIVQLLAGIKQGVDTFVENTKK